MSDSASDRKMWVVEAEVMPKGGVNDPQGEAVLSSLHSLGFASTRQVRCGKLIRMDVYAVSEADAVKQGMEMCERLLANPVIEEFVVSAASIADEGMAT